MVFAVSFRYADIESAVTLLTKEGEFESSTRLDSVFGLSKSSLTPVFLLVRLQLSPTRLRSSSLSFEKVSLVVALSFLRRIDGIVRLVLRRDRFVALLSLPSVLRSLRLEH